MDHPPQNPTPENPSPPSDTRFPPPSGPQDRLARDVGTSPDIGTPSSRLVALVLVVVLYTLIAVMQNFQPAPQPEVGAKPAGGEFAKLFLTLDEIVNDMGAGTGQVARSGATQLVVGYPADKLQGALVLGEGGAPEKAVEWVRAVRQGLDLNAYLAGAVRPDPDGQPSEGWAVIETAEGPVVDEQAVLDAIAIETLYAQGAGALSEESRARLVDRYGWLGELALAEGADREALFDTKLWAQLLMVALVVVFALACLGVLASIGLVVVLWDAKALRRRFVRPPRGGSVFLETFAVFLAGFGLVQVMGAVLVGIKVGAKATGIAVMVGQWSLILTLLWPVMRGVRFGEWRRAVGLDAKRGVFVEIFAGFVGYFLGLPLFLVGVLMTLVLTTLFGESGAAPSNPVIEMVRGSDVVSLLLFISLATVWAPIAEEILFRGSVYRHMRSRLGVLGAGLFTALLFAYLHSYGPLLTGPLIALGFTFALIREWRGSLIGAITAHCLHNSTVMAVMLLAMKAMA